ncbi:hypothetical protein [Streptomyces sp. CS014]|uniref:hypothetical protein n=1 Tax=Streptomyces sp. CS014 TaxID=2162707 RepID=UPI000D5145F5|nr:hypothetical protein [Streptomyces sp. CS014]PVC81767.1 hypothetical protein DBP12_36585 [Streptomyces sp. CS014]
MIIERRSQPRRGSSAPTPPPGYRHDSERLRQLAANWREAALELGEFAPQRPTLRLISETTAGDED